MRSDVAGAASGRMMELYLTSTSSSSNENMAFGGMTPAAATLRLR
jgi:hypothetical protein